MLTAYEREKITDFIGSQEAKINFLQKFSRVAHFGKSYSQFFSAGVYQLQDGPPILVLPWFLKKAHKLFDEKKTFSNDLSFFEVIREIKTFMNATVDLKKEGNDSNALDIVVYSYLINLHKIVKELLSFNFHEEIVEKTNVIKGRWTVTKDIQQGSRPIKFTCTYNSLEASTPLLIFIKTFCYHLASILRSKKNNGLVNDILGLLRDITNSQLNRAIIEEAYSWVKSHRGLESIIPVLDFAQSLALDQTVYSKEAGISYHFQMDKFFEELVLNFLRTKPEMVVMPQSSDELLGGALWQSNENNRSYERESKSARQFTVPDIVAFDKNNYFIFECKYKPLRIPFINSEDTNQELSSLSREDRNQLLSFIMSLRPTPELRARRVEFVLIFPSSFVERFKVAELIFESAKLNVDPLVRNLIQNRIKVENGSELSIKFIGVDIPFMIQTVISKTTEGVEEFISSILKQEAKSEKDREQSHFEKVVERRLALTSLIVDRSKKDPTLGRVKLAKMFYLADAHLKLNMEAQYLREVAGPLDSRLFYNEKWGIESRGIRLSYFRRIDNKKGFRYFPSVNIDQIVNKAKVLFVEKLENIDWLISLIQPLNTEQAEIVTTLYACWNDLLVKTSQATDDEIISEIHSNWHDSKKRFTKDKLGNALEWMRSKGLVPDGAGPVSKTKIDKVSIGF